MKKYLFLGLVFLGLTGVLGYLAWSRAEEAPIADSSLETIASEQELTLASREAKYKVKIDFTWSSETHPDSLPEGAHFSPVVLVAHSAEKSLLTSQTPAKVMHIPVTSITVRGSFNKIKPRKIEI